MTQNVDQQELEKFEKMATSWWDLEGDFKPIHRLNPLRLEFIEQQVAGLEGKRVLDVGCGGGILAESMAKRGASVTGIDMSVAPLAVARSHSLEQGLEIDYQQSTIEDFLCQIEQRQQPKFELITCMEMLEHVPDPTAVLQACAKLLTPQGKLIVSTINRSLKAWALVILGAEYVLKMLPKGTHQYAKFIKPAELIASGERGGLVCSKMAGYHYNPLVGRFWLNQDVSANYIAVFERAE